MKISQLEEEILRLINLGMVLYNKGLVEGSGGNISCRLGNLILIKRSGVKMNQLTPKDIILANITNESPSKVSSDYFIHRFIYLNTGYKYVIHAHPVNLIILSFSKNEIVPNTYDTKFILGEKLPVINPEVHFNITGYISQELLMRGIIIERGHGVYVARDDLDEALNIVETLEHLASILLNSI